MTAVTRAPASGSVAPIGPMLWQQTRAEFLKLWRNPGFSIASLALPVIFFAFFGLPNLHDTLAGVRAGPYIVASYSAYGVISVMLFSFGVGVAQERGQRLNVLMRATPLRPAVYLLAKVITALIFAFVMLLLLFTFAAVAGGVRMAVGMWLTLISRLLVGGLPFIALGFAVGYLASPNAAAPLLQIVFLPLSFASGLFLPTSMLPPFVQHLAPYLPTNRFGQVAWDAVGAQTHDALGSNILWLGGYGLVFVVLAVRAYQREEKHTFG